MTAPQPATPGSDSPTPGTETRLCEGECGCRYGTGDPDRLDCACDGPCCNADDAVWFAAPSPVVTTEPPAETQQDDEREAVAAWLWTRGGSARRTWDQASEPQRAIWLGEAARLFRDVPTLAARPSADAETLLQRVRELLVELETAPFMGRRTITDRLRAALDGPR